MNPGQAQEGTCAKCHKTHDPRHCDGHNRQGEQCGKARGQNTDHPGFGHCRWHGGCSPNGIKFAQQERQASAAFRLAKYGLDPIKDPLTELARVAAEQRQAAEYWAEQSNQLASLIRVDAAGTERIAAEAEQYRRSQNDARAVLAEMAHLNVDERMVGIQAQATDLLVEKVGAVLDAFKEELRLLLAPRLREGEAWPSEAELEGLYASALAQASGGG